MSARLVLLIIALGATAVRCFLAATTPIAPEEAYYLLCAQHPDAAYFDGPAGTAMFLRLFESFGAGNGLWHASFPLWGLIATLVLFALARAVLNDVRAAWCAVALNVIPFFNAACLRVGPALPALVFVLMGILCCWRISQTERPTVIQWLLAAVFFAAGTLFLYVAAIFTAFAMVFVLLSAKHRKVKDFAGAGLVIFVVGMSLVPSLLWNAQHDWIPIAGGTFQTLWAFQAKGFIQALRIFFNDFSVPIGLALFMGWMSTVKLSLRHPRQRFSFVLGLPAVLGWFYFALRGQSESQIFLLGTPVLLIPVTIFFVQPEKIYLKVFYALLLAIGLAESAMKIVKEQQAGLGWAEAVDETLNLDTTMPSLSEGLFFIAEDAHKAAILGYYLQDKIISPTGHPPVYVRESQDISSQFGLWPSYDDFIESDRVVDEYFTEQKGENPFIGRSAIYFSEENIENLPQMIRGAFESVILLHSLKAVGINRRPLYIYLCKNYQTMPL